MSAYDVVTLGETMLRLTPPNLQRIEQAKRFDVEVGGSESNVAVGLARLGLSVAWLSRLPDSPMGRIITNALRAQGVDTAHVVWSEHDRLGIFYLEEGKAPRGSRVFYDRANSAMSRMQPEHLPDNLFESQTAGLLHLSGITLALSDSAFQTTLRAAELAQAAGWRISFDFNYRTKLWSIGQAREGCHSIADMADSLILPVRDARALFDIRSEDSQSVLANVRERYPNAAVVLTLGANGAIGCEADGEAIVQAAFYAEAVDRIGGGDAFAAGFLYGYLRHDFKQALTWGCAAAAFKYSIPGDMPILQHDEVAALVMGQQNSDVKR